MVPEEPEVRSLIAKSISAREGLSFLFVKNILDTFYRMADYDQEAIDN